MRPSRPMTRETRASSRAWRALMSSSSLVRTCSSPMRSRLRVRRRGLKSPSLAAVSAARISSRAWVSRPLPPPLVAAVSAAAGPVFASVRWPAAFLVPALVVRVAIPSSVGGGGKATYAPP